MTLACTGLPEAHLERAPADSNGYLNNALVKPDSVKEETGPIRIGGLLLIFAGMPSTARIRPAITIALAQDEAIQSRGMHFLHVGAGLRGTSSRSPSLRR